MSISTAQLVVCVAVFAVACEEGTAMSELNSASDHLRRSASVQFGIDGLATNAEIGLVRAARMARDGSVVVADQVPPHVKVFAPDGSLRSAFMNTGGGPLETRGVATLAIGEDRILVAHTEQFANFFDFDGNGDGKRLNLAFIPLAAVRACNDAWVFYGPTILREQKQAVWLHVLDDTDLHSRAEYHTEPMPERISIGRPYGIVANADSVIVLHDHPNGSVLIRLNCKGGLEVVPVGSPSGEEVREQRRGDQAFLTTRRRPLPAGIAVIDECLVTATVDHLPGLTTGRTRFTVSCGDGGEGQLDVAGTFVLRDAQPGVGLLLETDEPYPHLFVVPTDRFTSMLHFDS